MKKAIGVASFLLLIILALITYKAVTAGSIYKRMPSGFAVVELFTSEGCSSCPAAEAAIARLHDKNLDQVYILSYHVDYWDRLGWKDPFSKAAFTQRQKTYAAAFHLQSLYTPQVVVNGQTQFVGSDAGQLNDAIEANLDKKITSNLTINAVAQANDVMVTYNITGNEPARLNVALVQPEATIKVKRGENSGRTLHHVNVVSVWQSEMVKGTGMIKLTMPQDSTISGWQVIAFTQDPNSYGVLGVDEQKL